MNTFTVNPYLLIFLIPWMVAAITFITMVIFTSPLVQKTIEYIARQERLVEHDREIARRQAKARESMKVWQRVR